MHFVFSSLTVEEQLPREVTALGITFATTRNRISFECCKYDVALWPYDRNSDETFTGTI